MNEPESHQMNDCEAAPVRMPWSPAGIAVLSLLLSPLPGSVLHALNYARLGLPERKRLTLFSNLIAAMVLVLIAVFLEGAFQVFRLTSALFVAAYFYKTREGLLKGMSLLVVRRLPFLFRESCTSSQWRLSLSS